jgi:methionyl-tRNA formyltransferase
MVTLPALRVAFFGTPRFAVPTLERLLASRHAVVGVVTQPDRARPRPEDIRLPVKACALAAGVPVWQPTALKDPETLTRFASLGADIGVVAAYGRILPEALLAIPPKGMINVHASLLPRHRGAAPVHRAIIDGDSETGVTIMRVVKALDAGPMLATVRRRIEDAETSEDVEQSLAVLGADLLVETLDDLARGAVREETRTIQPRPTRTA